MSADREFVLYHLVPSDPPSWQIAEHGKEPDGRLISSELEIYQGSPHNRESRHWKRVWVHPDLSPQQADELEERYLKSDRQSNLTEIIGKI
jgi:hypothetical protein